MKKNYLKFSKPLVLGIDATNLNGGCKVYITSLLSCLPSFDFPFSSVVIWAPERILVDIPDSEFIIKIHQPVFEKNFFRRGIWQLFHLSGQALGNKCDLLFVPGGAYLGGFRPVVTMYQNLLPFETSTLLEYSSIPFRLLKFLTLRFVYRFSLKRASGSIYLSEFARDRILSSKVRMPEKSIVLPHGLDDEFRSEHNSMEKKETFLSKTSIRILYVSSIELYKNTWNVVEAVANLRETTGRELTLVLAGPAEKNALSKLKNSIKRLDPERLFVDYIGELPREKMPELYRSADMAVFASSCENLPMIVLEKMAMGLPIACARYPAMVVLLGEDAEYFDPRDPRSISIAIRKVIEDSETSLMRVERNIAKAQTYQWPQVARDTFSFLHSVAIGDATQRL